MGWYGFISRQDPVRDVVDHILKPVTTEAGETGEVVYHALEGPDWARSGVKRLHTATEVQFELYLVREFTSPVSKHLHFKTLEVHLIRADAPHWMVKYMDETVGPYAVPTKPAIASELLAGIEGQEAPNKSSLRYRRDLEIIAARGKARL